MLSSAALGFFEGIAYFFKTIFELISNMFSDLIYVLESIGQVITQLPNWLAWLPASAVTIFMGGVTIIIIYKLLGRD